MICSFEEVYRQPNILAAWVSGPEAEAMLSLSDEQILKDCTRLLREFTANPAMAAPVRIIRTSWLNNPLFFGAYSYPTFYSSHRSFKYYILKIYICMLQRLTYYFIISDLAAPVPSEKQPRVLFAGEATHDHYYSTLHAAYNSGIREAERLIPLIRSGKPSSLLKHKL